MIDALHTLATFGYLAPWPILGGIVAYRALRRSRANLDAILGDVREGRP